jgi:hypothetical protein
MVVREAKATLCVCGAAGAWGFTCAMFYLSFFSHLYLTGLLGGPVDPRILTAVSGVLFTVSGVAFVSTLRANC